jgi:hypothetical protein
MKDAETLNGQPCVDLVVDLAALTPPVVEGRPFWPPAAVAAWLGAARAAGVEAVDRTYEHLDSVRDADDCYGGTVQVGGRVIDLYVDEGKRLRVVTDARYLA